MTLKKEKLKLQWRLKMKSETFAVGDTVFVFDNGFKVTETTITSIQGTSGTYNLKGINGYFTEDFISKDRSTGLQDKMAKYAKKMNDPKQKKKRRI